MRASVAVALAVLALPLLTACDQTPEDRDVVALLIADGSGDRWREQDLPAFAEELESSCADCVPVTRDAGGDAATQRRQFSEAIDAGADVIVLNAVTRDVGEELVQDSPVPVVAYDRLVPGADHLVDVDDALSSRQIARTLRGLLPQGRSEVLVVSDGPGGLTDRVTTALRKRVRVRASLPAGESDRAEAWSAEQWRASGPVAAVVTGDDAAAGKVAAGLAAAGVALPQRPILTGHDGGLDAVRRIVRGTQTVTVHASRADEAAAAAQVAVDLAQGRTPENESETEVEGVPAILTRPTVVTLPTLTDTLVRQGVYSIAEICEGSVRPRCERLGLR